MAMYTPIPSGSITRGAESVTISWSVNWNTTTNPRAVSVHVAPTASPNATVYSSTSFTGTNVVITGLTGATSYTLTVYAEGFSPMFGEVVADEVTYSEFTNAVTVWNGTKFVPVTATKVWNGTEFVKATNVKVNKVAGTSPTWGDIG